ncbi:MAG: hypothetical protein ABSD70_15610 [Terracidiphilus sp.]
MKAAELTGSAASQASGAAKRDLLSALAGKQAGRERAVAERTRRVVLTSAGVMKDQKADRKRSRSLALAGFLLMLLALGPFVWRVSDDLIGGEHWSDMATQTSLWVCVACPALLAAALVAGWSRTRR